EEEKSRLNLKYVIFGGEALSPGKLEQWYRRYPRTKLVNMFGITETTVHVTYKEIGLTEIEGNISNIGKPIPTTTTYVLDGGLRLKPVGVSGELCVGGGGVARGYLNRPELTASKFVPDPFMPAEKLYTSGDLGKVLDNGEIEYLGRMDHQVQLRGFRIELGEIESRLTAHPDIRDAVVIAREEDNTHYLCAYITGGGELKGLREYLSRTLPDYMVPNYFIALEEIPLTANGKVDRKRLPDPTGERGEGEYTAPESAVEMKLAEIWQSVLNVERVGITDNYFSIGGDSIKAIRLINAVNTQLGVNLGIVDIYGNQTIETLARHLESPAAGAASAYYEEAREEIERLWVEIAPQLEQLGKDKIEAVFPITDIEKGMFFHYLKDSQAAIYHDQAMYPVVYKAFDIERAKSALALMVEKHPILRSAYILEKSARVVFKPWEIEFPVHHADLSGISRGEQVQWLMKYAEDSRNNPFIPSRPPLWRLGFFNAGQNNVVVVWECHHSIIDGWSNASFLTEFNNTYIRLETEPQYRPAELRYAYREYMISQSAFNKYLKNSPETIRYWKEEMQDYKRLTLPPTPSAPGSGEFGSKLIDLGEALREKLRELGRRYNTGLKHLCFAAYIYMLNMMTYENDVVTGIVTNTRPETEDGDKVLGCFLNTPPVRVKMPFRITWSEYIRLIDGKLVEMKKHDKLSLFEIMAVTGEMAGEKNPFYDTFFNFIDFHVSGEMQHDNAAENRNGDNGPMSYAKTNMFFEFTINSTTAFFCIMLSYSQHYLNDDTAEKLCNYFVNALNLFIEKPDAVARKDQLLSSEEKDRLLMTCNSTAADYPRDKTIHRLFREQAARTPHAVAVVHRSHKPHMSYLTYSQLNKKSSQLAGYLLERGVSPGHITAVMMERSVEMIIGIFGILKAGGAYLPIDPHYPEERIDFMLKDSNAKIVLDPTPPALRAPLSRGDLKDARADSHGKSPLERALEGPRRGTPKGGGVSNLAHSPESLAYIIYTSGSTGKPKGVMIEHTSVVNRLNWMQGAYPIGRDDTVLQKTTYTFDVSVWELFWWSFYGASVYLLGPGEEKDAGAIIEASAKHRVTTMHFVPSMLNAFLDYLDRETAMRGLASLKQVFASGEALKVEQVSRFRGLLTDTVGTKLFNLYGPTEATVDVSYYNCLPGETGGIPGIPIGKPIDNIQLYIMSKYLMPQPVGVPGELCIAGVGLARGYLNRPELTSDRFCRGAAPSLSTLPPFHPSTLLYRTGDLARWLPDGNIEFLGRLDHQVKVRGFRIELGEIESRLTDCLPVKETVVTAPADSTGDNRLVAYVVPDEKHAFTVTRLTDIDNRGLHSQKSRYELPNGMPVFYLNRHETDFMYREVFEENAYLKHGITLPEGSCIFDIGANIGMFSLYAHHYCRNAEIYSFEPAPPLFELLDLNTSLYGGHFKVFKNGISAVEEEVEFTFYPHATVLSGRFADGLEERETVRAFIDRELEGAEGDKPSPEQIDELLKERLSAQQFRCTMKTLSQVIEENAVKRIDLLKIDVEKAELDVLKGIGESDWPRIRQLVVEVHDDGGRLKEILRLLENHGYHVTVEQDHMLEETGLYNLYAVSTAGQPGAGAEEGMGDRGDRWYSPGGLIRDLKRSLSDKLPDYMVPAHFVLLDEIPLTGSGKVDRRSLPLPEVKAGREYEAPANEMEETLAEIWAGVLNIGQEHIGRKADFFGLGGHSLKATIMTAKIHTTFGVKIPLMELFNKSTISELGRYIENARGRTHLPEDENLELLRDGPGGAGIFFIHDGSGDMDGYLEFCRRMEVSVKCWGLRLERDPRPGPRNYSIEALARQYIRRMKKVQPEGPYFLVGWSLGGTIAFEMARQLETGETGRDTVQYLVLVDSPPPRIVQEDPPVKPVEFSRETERQWVSDILPAGEALEKILKEPDIEGLWSAVIDYLEASRFDIDVIKKAIPGNMVRAIPNVDRLAIRELARYFNVIRGLDNARAAYVPTGQVAAPVFYFAAGETESIVKEEWSRYTRSPVTFFIVPGDHFSIFQPPRVKDFVEVFETDVLLPLKPRR
ncbi:MAG: amino acid adenylation domain-containing protein, partial [bacterium]|nr:amino acid adenylation domain-containing protein [bacterium]